MKPVIFKSFLFALFLAPLAQAGLMEGSWRGYSSMQRKGSCDKMNLMIREVPGPEEKYYAVLMEYTRLPIACLEGIAVTNWVPRMYAFEISKLSAIEYKVSRLVVVDGEIVPMYTLPGGKITQVRHGSMENMVLALEPESVSSKGEVITFSGNEVTSTWEPLVANPFLGTTESGGFDYFKRKAKNINTRVYQDSTVDLYFPSFSVGSFELVSSPKYPLFFVAKDLNAKGTITPERMTQGIVFFIDIVNWKKWGYTTNEMMVINPYDPKHVGFFYEIQKN